MASFNQIYCKRFDCIRILPPFNLIINSYWCHGQKNRTFRNSSVLRNVLFHGQKILFFLLSRHNCALLRIIPQKFVALLLHLGYFVALNEVKSSINQLHFINLRVLFFSQSFHRFSRYIGQHPSHYHIVQSVHPGTLSWWLYRLPGPRWSVSPPWLMENVYCCILLIFWGFS